MSEKIRLYREGLALGRWGKEAQLLRELEGLKRTTSSSSPSRSSSGEHVEGKLKAPATIIYGRDDPAFESRLVLPGIEKYLSDGSCVLVLEGSGHWLPSEEFGRRVIRAALEVEVESGVEEGEKGRAGRILDGVSGRRGRVEVLVDKE